MEEKGDPIIRAMLLGALGAGLLGAVVSFVLNGVFNPHAESLFALPVWIFVTLAPTIAIAVTLGIAWHAIALRMRWTSAIAYAIAGATAGFVIPASVYLLVASATLSSDLRSGLMLPALISGYGACIGALTCVLAWLIRRPDRDDPNPPIHVE